MVLEMSFLIAVIETLLKLIFASSKSPRLPFRGWVSPFSGAHLNGCVEDVFTVILN
jgi:hypothetical protein